MISEASKIFYILLFLIQIDAIAIDPFDGIYLRKVIVFDRDDQI